MLSGNKGEWSEIYTLFKIVADQKLYAGDSKLNRIENLYYPIIKILRFESNGTYEYTVDSDIVIIKNSVVEFKIPIRLFAKNAQILLSHLLKVQKSSFVIPEIEDFLSTFDCNSLKAKSTSKSDILIQIHDIHTGSIPELGFSIKSQLGSPSTLLNSSKSTGFRYKITGTNFTEEDICRINKINTKSKIKDRIKSITDAGGTFEFVSANSSIFENNLTLIDSFLPNIISSMLYLYFTTDVSNISGLINKISEDNPLCYNSEHSHPYYNYKIKRFLTDIALGMMPAKVWNGKLEATGGYLIVRQDGEILCYHIYNRNEFEDYLLNNTRLDSPSSTRHNYGKIIENNSELFFNLNLQIRFIN